MRVTTDGIDNQVQIAIAIQVGKRGAGRVQTVAGDAGRLSDIRKLPVAQIVIECAGTAQVTEEQIAQAVAIDVSRRNARAVEKNLIGQVPLFGKRIGEGDSRVGR